MNKNRRILGIDPGSRITGYGIIETAGSEVILCDFGCIRPPTTLSIYERYRIIHEATIELILRFEPQILSIETQYFPRQTPNVNSLIKLGMARGVVLLAAAQHQLSIHEYPPARVKQAVVGNGRASKEQVQGMIQRLLKLSSIPKPPDAADALALAICHAHSLRHLGESKCMLSSADPSAMPPLPKRSLKPKALASCFISPLAPTPNCLP